MVGYFLKALRQLSDRRARRVLWLGLLAATCAFAALWGAVGYALSVTEVFDAWYMIPLKWVIDLLGGVTVLWLTWVLFPGVATFVMSFLLEGVAEAVEARHYPDLPPAPGQGLGRTLIAALRFLATMVALNLVLLVFMLFAPVFPFVFYCVNGYLLGREYFELVALRRLDPAAAWTMRRRYRGRVFLAGVFVAVLLTVPGVNLVAPVIATAAMIHLFQAARTAEPTA